MFALDLVTGEETSLSLDGGYFETCQNGVFAVDVDTGAFTQVVPRLL